MVLMEPDQSSGIAFMTYPTQNLAVLGTIEGWVKVSTYFDGTTTVGWVEDEYVDIINSSQDTSPSWWETRFEEVDVRGADKFDLMVLLARLGARI